MHHSCSVTLYTSAHVMSCGQLHRALWEGRIEEVEVAEITGKLVDVLHKTGQVLQAKRSAKGQQSTSVCSGITKGNQTQD